MFSICFLEKMFCNSKTYLKRIADSNSGLEVSHLLEIEFVVNVAALAEERKRIILQYHGLTDFQNSVS